MAVGAAEGAEATGEVMEEVMVGGAGDMEEAAAVAVGVTAEVMAVG